VDPVPDPLLLRISGSAGNRTQTSRCVAMNCHHYTIEAVVMHTIMALKFMNVSIIADALKQPVLRCAQTFKGAVLRTSGADKRTLRQIVQQLLHCLATGLRGN
jgi:hypothetical protein